MGHDPHTPSADWSNGNLRAFPDVIDFKDVVVGHEYIYPVRILNSGTVPYTISNVYRSNSSFRLEGIKFPLTIAPGKTIALAVSFRPARTGKLSGTFRFIGKRAASRNLLMTAQATAVTKGVSPTVSQLNFGTVSVGLSVSHPITLINSGSIAQTILSIKPAGNDFNVSVFDGPLTLEPRHSITFDAWFLPSRVAAFKGSAIVRTSGGFDLEIPLAGSGSKAPAVVITPHTLNFGNISVGKTATLTATFRAGAKPVTIYSAGITNSEFALAGLSFPFTIPARQSRAYQVTFSPRSSGAISGDLRFESANQGFMVQQGLSGNAAPSPPSGSQHTVFLSWIPAKSPVSGYNVYRANSPNGPYSQLNSVPDPNASYRDGAVVGGHNYYYVTTSVGANGKQSRFSNQVAVSIPQ